MPSRWEGFGLVALEAMRCETAVFAARQGGLVELVEDGVTGALFDTADQLGELLAKTERIKLHEQGRAGRRRFLELFTHQRMVNELMALLAQL